MNARDAFAGFVADYPRAHGYAQRMLALDRLVHAVHTSGNTVVRLARGRYWRRSGCIGGRTKLSSMLAAGRS